MRGRGHFGEWAVERPHALLVQLQAMSS